MRKAYKCPFIARGTQHICALTDTVCEWSNSWPYYLECPHYLSRQKKLWEVPPNYEDLIVADEVDTK